MSQEYYQQQWKNTQMDLTKALAADAKIKKKGPYPNLKTAKWLVSHLFMSYVRIVNRLDECYDQMIHPQKREVIGRLLDMSLGRLLEIKADIVRLELDDYVFFDNVLIELKLTHEDMEIHVPKYFWKNREQAIAHRKALIKQIFEEAEKERFKEDYLWDVTEENREQVWQEYLAKEEQLRIEREKQEEQQRKMEMQQGVTLKDSIEILKNELKEEMKENKEEIVEAIALLQRHERARQGRKEAILAKRKKILRRLAAVIPKIPQDVATEAAKVIQTHWRRHWRKVQEKREKKKLTDMMGMMKMSFRDPAKYKMLENVSKLRKKMQDRNQREYEEALIKVKEKVISLYSTPMEEDTVDEIMAWFKWHFEQSGYLPDYPPPNKIIPTGQLLGIPKKLGPTFAEKFDPPVKKKGPPPKAQKMTALGIALAGISEIGGSALVVAGHWLGPAEFLVCQMELEKKGKGGGGKSEPKEKPTKEELAEMKKKQKELEKRMLLAEEAAGFKLNDSNFLTPLNKAGEDYRVNWMDLDERKNPEQRYIYELVKDEKCYELSLEVRAVVDEMMELELEILKDARERDKNPKKKKKKGKPKKKGGKEKKKKGKKDPTGHRTLDDLFMELFKNGIIREVEEAHLKEYLGERSYGAFDMRERLIDWPPSTGDVRELILQLCILPLGSSRIHQLCPLIKSVCLLGTENSAKGFLARIICTETASVVFDLSPSNVVGKYPGKDGLKMLQHLVEKMSRALQPSVIFVDEAEKTFYKKVPKEEKDLDPKRLAPMISKLAKNIKPEDQVLLLGVSSQPWLSKKNKFLKAFQKTIQVPQMDYGTYVGLWHSLLMRYHSVPGDFDVSCLSRVSEGFSVKTIMDAVQNVLTIERIGANRKRPYTPAEFLEELLKTKPTDPKLQEKSLKFYSGLELPKKKAKRLKEMLEEIEKPDKKK